ncbi:hypothetical protein GLOIN_2v1735823 [Rhizophagus irregularis DAOM 181602=DAOM 197198]|uniref:Uncharacterized protein n=1 Tax=Rhizophagus irregularis (strain DAOM 181602 / DAOM 197198 / MUCL 43194) TaxID=747089 RepID=U9U9M4_RHIID|nr:hypothetical protein GLOIN_2v1735823 [Rhizophagus irregularis DAOM 181602=DAOM 197198]
MDTFLDDAHKKSVNNGIGQRNREKYLSKAEQASLNQDQESDSRKKGAESIVLADGIKDDAQSSDCYKYNFTALLKLLNYLKN